MSWSPLKKLFRTRKEGEPGYPFASLSDQGRARIEELRAIYDIAQWPDRMTDRELLGNLFTLDILHRLVGQATPPGPSLDVGSARWWYLPALVTFRPGPWTGIELPTEELGCRRDGWRERAETMAGRYPNACYREGCLTELTGRFAFITWFLPYVALPPLLSAGLPAHRFDPAGLLRHVYDLLDPGGVLLLVNQGAAEAELQREILVKERLAAHELGELTSALNPFAYPRFGWLLTRD